MNILFFFIFWKNLDQYLRNYAVFFLFHIDIYLDWQEYINLSICNIYSDI